MRLADAARSAKTRIKARLARTNFHASLAKSRRFLKAHGKKVAIGVAVSAMLVGGNIAVRRMEKQAAESFRKELASQRVPERVIDAWIAALDNGFRLDAKNNSHKPIVETMAFAAEETRLPLQRVLETIKQNIGKPEQKKALETALQALKQKLKSKHSLGEGERIVDSIAKIKRIIRIIELFEGKLSVTDFEALEALCRSARTKTTLSETGAL